jgi:hypothetical protein
MKESINLFSHDYGLALNVLALLIRKIMDERCDMISHLIKTKQLIQVHRMVHVTQGECVPSIHITIPHCNVKPTHKEQHTAAQCDQINNYCFFIQILYHTMKNIHV